MPTVGDIIRRARIERGLTQTELARLVGVTKGAISQWETGRGMPDKIHIPAVARTLNLPLSILLGGDSRGNVAHISDERPRRWVPLVSWTSAGKGAVGVEPYPVGVGVEYLEVSGEYSTAAFALEVRGNSMSPMFAEGDTIIVDPTIQPQRYDFVIAELGDDGDITFKQYVPRGSTMNGKPVFDLVPLNPEEPTITVNAANPGRIIGKVVEHRHRLP